MNGSERLYSYLQLRLHGYTHAEAEEIIETIIADMKKDEVVANGSQ